MESHIYIHQVKAVSSELCWQAGRGTQSHATMSSAIGSVLDEDVSQLSRRYRMLIFESNTTPPRVLITLQREDRTV